jgi:Uma2 family endonuclease
MVVFGRPKGYRGSYKQWEEDGLAPQVVFEVRSPANGFKEMLDKLAFYEQYLRQLFGGQVSRERMDTPHPRHLAY